MNKRIKVANLVAFAAKNQKEIDWEDFDFTVSELLEIVDKIEAIESSLTGKFHLPLSGENEDIILNAVRVFDDMFDESYRVIEDELKAVGFNPYNYREYHDGRIEIDCDNEFRYI